MTPTYLVDTNVLIDMANGKSAFAGELARASRIWVSPVVQGEYLAGIGDTRRDSGKRHSFECFLSLPNVAQAPIGAATAECYARLWRVLSATGRRIPSNDLWIAAQAWELSATLVTADRHFGGIPGLSVLFEPYGEG